MMRSSLYEAGQRAGYRLPKIPKDENGKEIRLSDAFDLELAGKPESFEVKSYYITFYNTPSKDFASTWDIYRCGMQLAKSIRLSRFFPDKRKTINGRDVLAAATKLALHKDDVGNFKPYNLKKVMQDILEKKASWQAKMEEYGRHADAILAGEEPEMPTVKAAKSKPISINIIDAFERELHQMDELKDFVVVDPSNPKNPEETFGIYRTGISLIKQIRETNPELCKTLTGQVINDKAALAYYKLLHKDYDDLSKGGEGFSRS